MYSSGLFVEHGAMYCQSVSGLHIRTMENGIHPEWNHWVHRFSLSAAKLLQFPISRQIQVHLSYSAMDPHVHL